MEKVNMLVHPLEKELLELIRNEVPFGTIHITSQDGLPIDVVEARNKVDLRRRVVSKIKNK